MDTKEKHRIFLIGGVVAGGGLLLLLFHSNSTGGKGRGSVSSSPSKTPRTPSTPNPGNLQLEQAIISAREAALGTYDNSAIAEYAAEAQQALGINQDASQVAINYTNNQAQYKETGLATAAAQAINAAQQATAEKLGLYAEEAQQAQYTAAQQIASDQQQASETQSNDNLFSGIFSFLGGIFGF